MNAAQSTHIHSIRLASGEEALVARVVAKDGRVGLGFSFRLEATEARHMAEWAAGMRGERPAYRPALGHPWEKAWRAQAPIPWAEEKAFLQLGWLPTA